MKAEFVRPLLAATIRVFERLSSGACKVHRPLVARTLCSNVETIDIIIRLSGCVDGALVLRLPHQTAQSSVRTLLGPEWCQAGLQNGVMEMARMIGRIARRDTRPAGLWLAGAVIQYTDTNAVLSLGMSPWLITEIDSPLGNFTFAVCMAASATARATTTVGVLHRATSRRLSQR